MHIPEVEEGVLKFKWVPEHLNRTKTAGDLLYMLVRWCGPDMAGLNFPFIFYILCFVWLFSFNVAEYIFFAVPPLQKILHHHTHFNFPVLVPEPYRHLNNIVGHTVAFLVEHEIKSFYHKLDHIKESLSNQLHKYSTNISTSSHDDINRGREVRAIYIDWDKKNKTEHDTFIIFVVVKRKITSNMENREQNIDETVTINHEPVKPENEKEKISEMS